MYFILFLLNISIKKYSIFEAKLKRYFQIILYLHLKLFFSLNRMKKYLELYIYIIVTMVFTSCSVNKFIPEEQYLLDKVNIISDTKEVQPSLFTSYIRQNPNSKWFNLVKVPMHIYCLSGKDSTNSFNRFLQKLGDAPVIYDPIVSEKSKKEMEKADAIGGFLFEIKELESFPIEFSERLWHNMVDHVKVYEDDRLVFVFRNGMKITEFL